MYVVLFVAFVVVVVAAAVVSSCLSVSSPSLLVVVAAAVSIRFDSLFIEYYCTVTLAVCHTSVVLFERVG